MRVMKNVLSCGARPQPAVLKRPGLFIAGAPKCGTTALASYLSEHPDIYLAKKEMHFFGADLHFGRRFYRRDLRGYLEEFSGWKNERLGGEASVWYLFSATTAAEIHAFNPDARVLIMLREPARMLHSLHHQFCFDGNEHLSSFAAALAAEGDRREGRQISRRAYFAQGLLYRKVAAYAEQVKRYFDVFGRDRVRVLLYEEFASDPQAAYRETLDFLELEWPQTPPEFKVINPARRARSSLVQSILSEPCVRGTAIRLGRCLPQRIFTWFQRIELRLLQYNTRVASPDPLAPELRARLQAEFAPEVERLSELLQLDLEVWNIPPTRSQSEPREMRTSLSRSACLSS